jgi:RES domain-containing protein
MTLRAWRIVAARHVAAAFSGDGARRYGGRWNRKGTRLVYTAATPSLAVLEMLVHLDAHELLRSYRLCEVSFPERIVEQVNVTRLSRKWRSDPPSAASRRVGDAWVREARSGVLRVPSVLVESEWNYLLNPAHPDYRRITIGKPVPFQFDPRLIKS